MIMMVKLMLVVAFRVKFFFFNKKKKKAWSEEFSSG